MPEYCIYTVDFNGHIAVPPKVIECSDDDGAVQKAWVAIAGQDVELWQGKRHVVRLSRYQKALVV